MTLPRILVIDDQVGGARKDRRNRLREDFCEDVELLDVTGDVAADPPDNPVAEAVFCRGQVVEDGQVRNDLAGTLDAIRKGWQKWPRWSLLLLDMQFKTGRLGSAGEPEGRATDGDADKYFGLTILESLSRDPVLREVPVVVLSAMPRAQIEKRFAAHGAFEFVDKNDLKTRAAIERLLEDHGLSESDRIIGRSIPLLKCLREARQRAKMGNDNVLLLGETGTGKELLARYIHDCSPRHEGPYVIINTQGVPETVIDDRLFGHVKGAFWGAMTAQAGAGEAADHGTLFVDEFGDVPALIQTKLLRLLDKNLRESQRIGSRPDGILRLDLQVVLATNRLDILESEDFRQDLLFRVGIAEAIRVPPLRERREDIPLLAEHFVRKCELAFKESLGAETRSISDEAMQVLCDTDWQGNVRGLEKAIEAAVYRFPKLRSLSPLHLRPSSGSVGAQTVAVVAKPSSPEQKPRQTQPSLADLMKEVGAFEFSETAAGRSQWTGKLPELQMTFARAAAGLLRAALLATRKATPKNPAGDIKITPAVKLAMGDDRIKTPKAADIVKRVLSIDPSVREQLMADPILKEAYEISVKQRPKTTGAGRKDASSGP